jgi:hypothetical protein
MARASFAAASPRLRRFEPFFSSRTRVRGLQYAAAGKVSLTEANHAWLAATVRGTDRYEVELALRGGKLAASCTCPYFADSAEACKHVWATLLVGEDEEALPWLSAAQRLVLDPFGALDEPPSEGDAEDDDRPFEGGVVPPLRPPPSRPPLRIVPAERQRTPAVSWRDVLSRGRSSPSATLYGGRADLRYVIDTKETRARGKLHVRLFKRVGKASAPEWRATSVAHPLAAFAPPADALVVAMLEACGASSYYTSYSQGTYDLPAEMARELVERMAR